MLKFAVTGKNILGLELTINLLIITPNKKAKSFSSTYT